MSISFTTVTEVIFVKKKILYKNICRVTILFFVYKALKSKIGIVIAHLVHAFFPKIYKLFNLTEKLKILLK